MEPLFRDEYLAQKFATGRTPVGAAVSGYIRRIRTLTRTKQYDLVVVHCEMFPYLPRWFERLFTSRGVPCVLDFDDAIFLQYEEDAGRLVQWLYSGKMTQVFADMTLVMAGNRYLADRARRDAEWVEIIPTVVDTDRYAPRASSSPPQEAFTVGWIGSPSTGGYLETAAEGLRNVCAHDGSRVLIVGASDVSLPGVRLTAREWSEETEVGDIRAFDVGIMPLPDTSWARGKCGFKLIQYMACGIPVVASPVGVNGELVEHGINGFLAREPQEWTSALVRLREDPALRRRMGEAGRALVERLYSVRAMAPRVISLFRRAARAALVDAAPTTEKIP